MAANGEQKPATGASALDVVSEFLKAGDAAPVTPQTTQPSGQPDSTTYPANKWARKGVKQPTDDEHAERIDMAARLLSFGFPKSKIKQMMFEKYGCKARTVERYLSRARDENLALTKRAREEWLADALRFCRSIKSSDATVRDKLRAQEIENSLLGLEAPKYIHSYGDSAGTTHTTLSTLSDDEILKLRREIEERETRRNSSRPTSNRGNGEENGNGDGGRARDETAGETKPARG